MCSMYLGLSQKPGQSLKQLQRLIMTPQMQQAIHLMQLPVMELAEVVEAELELNPVIDSQESPIEDEIKEESQDQDIIPEKELRFDDKDFEILKQLDEDFRDHFSQSENYYTQRTIEEDKAKTYSEQSIPLTESLFEHLMCQARQIFQSPEELAMAEILIGNFDESGLLSGSLKDMALLNNFDEDKLAGVLAEVQKFDPYGIGASSLRESLLIQLRCQNKTNTLAYAIIDQNYEDLLHNRIPAIAKAQHCTLKEVKDTIAKHLARLDLHPGTLYSKVPTQILTADATIKQDGDNFEIVINDDRIPVIRFNSRYLRMLDDESIGLEIKDFIKGKIIAAKWLFKNIEQRNLTINRIVSAIAEKQKNFFSNPEGKLNPLTMKTLAQELALHESTIARAVANKYIETPRGLFPMRYFFSNAYLSTQGEDLSSKTVREYLKKIIDEENKMKPLSDESISRLITEKGISCARRTVAKYRTEMNIGNAKQRKRY